MMKTPCEHCGRRPFEGIVPSKGDFPEPLKVCSECAIEYPYVDKDGFPVTHFRSESGHWFFVFIHRDYLYPYFYPSARPDYKYLHFDKVFKEGGGREKEEAVCARQFPYHYDPASREEFIYFAYGSAMDERLLRKRDIDCSILGIATLFEARLDFSKPVPHRPSIGTANLRIGGREDFVMGMLLRFEKEDELKKLDLWGEVAGKNSIYRRILVHLFSNGQPVPALTHIYSYFRDNLRPSPAYKKRLVSALKLQHFPLQWISKIEACESFPGDNAGPTDSSTRPNSMNLPAVLPDPRN